MQIVPAYRVPGRFSRVLHGRQQQGRKPRDNHDHHQDFDQGKTGPTRPAFQVYQLAPADGMARQPTSLVPKGRVPQWTHKGWIASSSSRLSGSIVINDTVVVTVLGVKGDTVRLGINAPLEIPAYRQEVHEKIRYWCWQRCF